MGATQTKKILEAWPFHQYLALMLKIITHVTQFAQHTKTAHMDIVH